ncbi:MAG: 2-C-methyl-D-erythritol 2,4-cyclodiphosphate synthase, partial [Lachnospiraceae bacterium]|nr:2-C-methyl-D-erythritol 2,4-cyclodiphosphate synthase [Lachnospiraceae bacterium]
DNYKGVSSRLLLKEVAGLIDGGGFEIGNIDATIIAQAPKMRPFIDEMRENIAKDLGVDISRISVKATTEEGLGFTGNGDGISAAAVALINEK